MAVFRVLKEYTFIDRKNRVVKKKPGDLIQIELRTDEERLKRDGVICNFEFSHVESARYSIPALPHTKTLRIGFWIFTSSNYSGGRVHMYQYAWCMADLGAEVFIITNDTPKWAKDYPPRQGPTILLQEKHTIPPDLDIVITDSKTDLGLKALEYKHRHPWCKFFCFNFETPNWVAEFCPDYAKRLAVSAKVFNQADYLLANSAESKKYLLEWVKYKHPCSVLPPAVNTFALEAALSATDKVKLSERPYAVFSARAAQHKQGQEVVDAIWDLKIPFDLVVFGKIPHPPANTNLHQYISFEGKGDIEKFQALMGAHMTLAPSLFEGYGMVPGESLASGTQVVVYDLPVLRQEYGNVEGMHYVPWNDKKELKRVIHERAEREKPVIDESTVQTKYGMQAMRNKVESIPFHTFTKKKLSVHLISYWGFLPQSLQSVYEYADEIFIAYGPTEIVKQDGVPPDGSLKKLEEFPDPDKKIKMEVRDVWRDKLQMRQWCADRFKGNYHLLLDGDEIWHNLHLWLEADIPFGCPRWVNLWHGGEHWIYDSTASGMRWGYPLKPFGSLCPHYRWSWWRPTYRFTKHPVASDQNDTPLHLRAKEPPLLSPETVIYHLGHALPRETMKHKHQFYLSRDGDDAGRRKRRDVWHNWKGEVGEIGDGIVAKVDWELPTLVKEALDEI